MNKKIILLTLLILLFCMTGCKNKKQEQNPHTHSIVKKEAVEATCNSHGNIEYFVCSDCNKLFLDADARVETDSEKLIISNLICKDEDNDYYCDYNCGKIFLLNEEVQAIIENTLKLPQVTVKENYVPGANNNIYYYDNNFIYKYIDYPPQEDYFYKEEDKIFNITTYIDEWKLEEYQEELSFSLMDFFNEKFNLTVLTDISIWKLQFSKFAGKTGISFKNELELKITIIVDENMQIMEGLLIFDENGNYTHEIEFEFGINEEIVTVFENIKDDLNSYQYDENTNTFSVFNAKGLNKALAFSETFENQVNIKLMNDINGKGIIDEYNDMPYAFLVKNGNVKLDLNGFMIYSDDDVSAIIQIGDIWGNTCDASLTIDDSSIEKNGKIYSKKVGIRNYGGKLDFNYGTIEVNCETEDYASAIDSYLGNITINDGNFIVKSNSTTFISVCIDDGGSFGILTIKNGYFSVEGNHGITLHIRGTAYIDGGSYKSSQNQLEIIGKAYLGVNEEGIGAKFIDGIKSYNPITPLLTEGTGFYEDNDVKITMNDTATQLTGYGDITIKKK